ncbi:MAG: hypothetical protein ACE5HR_00185 [bacterium]
MSPKSTTTNFNTQKDAEQNAPFYLMELDGLIWGTTGSSSTSTNVYLGASASSVDGIYDGHQLKVGDPESTTGTETRTINTYTGSTKIANVSTAFTIPTASVKYEVSNTYYFANWSNDVVIGATTYKSRGFNISDQGITENAIGEVDSSDIMIDDVDRQIVLYANAYNSFKERELRLHTIFLDELTIADAITDVFDVRTVAFKPPAASILVRFAINPQENMLHLRTWLAEGCPWKYKDSNTCRYNPDNIANLFVPGPNGETDFCSKSFHGPFGCKFGIRADGEFRRNTENFGGAPGMPDPRLIVFVPTKGR